MFSQAFKEAAGLCSRQVHVSLSYTCDTSGPSCFNTVLERVDTFETTDRWTVLLSWIAPINYKY